MRVARQVLGWKAASDVNELNAGTACLQLADYVSAPTYGVTPGREPLGIIFRSSICPPDGGRFYFA
jgi:hypothetical protein